MLATAQYCYSKYNARHTATGVIFLAFAFTYHILSVLRCVQLPLNVKPQYYNIAHGQTKIYKIPCKFS